MFLQIIFSIALEWGAWKEVVLYCKILVLKPINMMKHRVEWGFLGGISKIKGPDFKRSRAVDYKASYYQ